MKAVAKYLQQLINDQHPSEASSIIGEHASTPRRGWRCTETERQ